MFCSVSPNSTGKVNFSFERPELTLQINDEDLHKLHVGPLKISVAKFNDVTQLASKYVPHQFQWFYISLISEDNNITNNYDSDYD